MSFAQGLDVDEGGEYIKLKAGEVATFHILSEIPEKSVVHWVNKEKKSCMGKGKCEYCLEGNKAKQRWSAMVWDRKDKSAKKFEFGASIAKQIKAIAEMLAESQQEIKDVDIRIKTEGSGIDTEYSVLHVPFGGEIPKEIIDQWRLPF